MSHNMMKKDDVHAMLKNWIFFIYSALFAALNMFKAFFAIWVVLLSLLQKKKKKKDSYEVHPLSASKSDFTAQIYC